MSSLTLNCIMKNEEHNLARMIESVKDVVDEICILDTGSTDNSIELAKSLGARVESWAWQDDFAAARNRALEMVKTDYFLWMDLDDTLKNPSAFLDFKNNIMPSADLWLAQYDYALDESGNPVCTFMRERVAKKDIVKWKYFVHEGLEPFTKCAINNTKSWSITHHRGLKDIDQDRGRNLRLFEAHKRDLDPRMTYYYGKELFEAGRKKEALEQLLKSVQQKELDIHDRTVAIQYACFCLMQQEHFDHCIDLALGGISISPMRAEFWVMIGDCMVKKGKLIESVPFYQAAKHCPQNMGALNGFIFQNKEVYEDYPRNQLARVYAHIGQFDQARMEASSAWEMYKKPESEVILKEVDKINSTIISYKDAKPCEDIVFTCLGSLYEFDELVAKERGVGGSEIALIEMARHMKELTGRRVRVFAPRREFLYAPSGVEYVSHETLASYFAENKPALHIAWRHAQKLTDAPTYVWAHDLIAPGMEEQSNYEKILVLSDFHKHFVKNMANIAEDKIYVTRNGIEPSRFGGVDFSKKNPFKIVWASSPDRGLDTAIEIIEMARSTHPFELHVFYGLENMKKVGKVAEAEHFEQLMKKDWIHYHGNVSQSDLPKHYEDASIWFYPTNFLETYCITAIEMALCGVYPVVRSYGALPNTLKGIPSTIIKEAPSGVENMIKYASALCEVVERRRWEELSIDAQSLSWEGVAKDWIEKFLS